MDNKIILTDHTKWGGSLPRALSQLHRVPSVSGETRTQPASGDVSGET